MRPGSVPRRGPVLVGMTCCLRELEGCLFQVAADKYVKAVRDCAGAEPILLPSFGEGALALLPAIHGLLLTGSPSNIEPHHYDGPPPPAGNQTDPVRDATTLPLIRAALAADMPILGICRGLQELNVAMGGSLYQEVHAVEGRLDHREDTSQPIEVQWGPRHRVSLTPGGVCATLAHADELTVNSLHGQGVERVAADLLVDAVAPDGQIEAVRHPGASFVMAVQWHPEWRAKHNPFSRALFGAFGDACRRFAEKRAYQAA